MEKEKKEKKKGVYQVREQPRGAKKRVFPGYSKANVQEFHQVQILEGKTKWTESQIWC